MNSKKVLDFGTGIGTFPRLLRAHKVNVLCLEKDKALQARLRKDGLFVYDSLESIPDTSLDYIYSLNVFEHIEDDAASLKLIGQKLVKGGKVFVYVPAFSILYSILDIKVGHYRRYTKSSLQRLFQNGQFEIAETSYADSVGFFVTFIYKHLYQVSQFLKGNRRGQGDNTAKSAWASEVEWEIPMWQIILFDRFLFPFSLLFDFIFRPFIGKNVWIVAVKK